MRIRSIKPEFWRSDDVAGLSREDRLLFIGLWSYVDDNGVGIDDHRQVAADLFALDDDVKEVREYVREGLATLSRRFLIARYEVDGKRYLYVTGWKRHQRIDKPAKGRYPEPPPDYKPPTRHDVPNREDVAEESRDPRETLAPGTGEQGNRGTGESAAPPPPARASARRRRGGEHVPPAELDRTAHGGRAHVLLTQWAEQNPGQLSSRRRELAREIDQLLAEGADPTLIPAALDEAHGNPRWRDPVRALRYAYSDVLRATSHRPRTPVLAAVPDRVPTTTARVQGALALLDPEEP